MNIVLVSVGNFQEYILVNIKQLIFLGHKSIYIITESAFFDKFQETYENVKIHLIDQRNLPNIYNYKAGNLIDTSFRNGFWELTSIRLFLVQSLMKVLDLEDVIHLENDVLIYYNCDSLINTLDKKKIYFPVDTLYRAIASIMYIPNHSIFGNILLNYNTNLTDMQNLSRIQDKLPHLFDNFPICFQEPEFTYEQKYVTRLYNQFNIIFDGAAIGQYVGGIDPRNTHDNENTIGFVSKECVIKYDKYDIIWQSNEKHIRRPFLCNGNTIIPIFNLHIHSKKLEIFCSYTIKEEIKELIKINL
jgi:hypothetical protein